MEAPRELVARRSLGSSALPEAVGGIGLQEVPVGDVSCVVCEPDRARSTFVWFHGGGFRMGSARSSAQFGLALATTSRARVVLVDYALAPEDPFPAALHDAAAVYEDAHQRWGPLVVGGDSAGGGLAVSLTKAVLQAGIAKPRAVVALSPWCDLTVTSSSYETNVETDPLFSASAARDAVSLYLQGWDPTDTLASPVLGDLSGFPPALIFASTDEVLLGDALRLGERLAASRVPVTMHLVPGVHHVWPVLDQSASESVAALGEIARFTDPDR
jgi:epsilon-lactone hydrolase